MRVRSVTLGTNLSYPIDGGGFSSFGAFQARARTLFGEAGLEVQTVRLATQPFPEVPGIERPEHVVSFARELEALCQDHGLDFCSIGTVDATRPGADLCYLDALPDVIHETHNTFASALIAGHDSGINLAATRRAAQVIYDVARVEANGFGNLRFAVLANCGPGSPFFPASYHRGQGTGFAVATEAADLAVSSFAQAKTLDQAQENLRTAVEATARTIEGVCYALEGEFGL